MENGNRQQIAQILADFETKLIELDTLPRDYDLFVIGWPERGLFFDYDRSMACGLGHATQFRKGDAYRTVKNGHGEHGSPIAMPAAIDLARDSLRKSIRTVREALDKAASDT